MLMRHSHHTFPQPSPRQRQQSIERELLLSFQREAKEHIPPSASRVTPPPWRRGMLLYMITANKSKRRVIFLSQCFWYFDDDAIILRALRPQGLRESCSYIILSVSFKGHTAPQFQIALMVEMYLFPRIFVAITSHDTLNFKCRAAKIFPAMTTTYL